MYDFPQLKSGDKIALACPGSRCLDEQEAITAKAYLEQQGFEVVYDKECYTYCSPVEKAGIFMRYLQDPTVKLIWLLRGGVGCADLLPTFEQQRSQLKQLVPTLLFGFSDFTVLLNYFAFQFNWQVVHGMGAIHFANDFLDAESKRLSLDVIQGKLSYEIPGLKPLNTLAEQAGPINAVCCGGTLSLLNIAIADVWQFDVKDKILIIEDVNEKAYRIIRTLHYLQRIGFFNAAKAIVLGDFNARPIGNRPEEQAKAAADILRYLDYFAETCDCPVFHTDYIGHGKTNSPVLFNYPVQLSAKGSLKFSGDRAI